jgi:hypothetical protein
MYLYHPYFRGKQYELITIRERASLLKTAGFRPIIEPVREALSGLEKTLDAVVKTEGHAILVVNPHYGDLSGTGPLTQLLKHKLDLPGISAGILLKPNMKLDEVLKYYEAHIAHTPVFIHVGFGEAKALAENLGNPTKDQFHIFFEQFCGKLYQKHFKDAYRVLLRDGFKRQRRNIDYPFLEPFSDLHATFADESMDGFGDFLIVGDEYSESGGPAYAVAIHLTFIDPDQDDLMQIYHFKSQRRDTPQDPAGKFGEALARMIKTLDVPGSNVLETNAVKEFRTLHRQRHFPGLGYVKKLSMNHHIETLADYFNNVA